jgi:hemoglobin
MQTQTLYDRVGGQAGVTRLIGSFYQRLLADAQLSPFFATIPMEKLQRMQVEFFTAALGGPLQYSGRPLAHVHHGRGITKTHLRRFTEHLLATLESIPLSQQDIQSIYNRIAVEADEIAEDAEGLGSGCEAG